jgi:signal transduction histidine kinase
MFASVNHELKTPINVITNCLICLKSKTDNSGLRWINMAETSCKFLLSLVNDTMDFASMKLGKFALNYSIINPI